MTFEMVSIHFFTQIRETVVARLALLLKVVPARITAGVRSSGVGLLSSPADGGSGL